MFEKISIKLVRFIFCFMTFFGRIRIQTILIRSGSDQKGLDQTGSGTLHMPTTGLGVFFVYLYGIQRVICRPSDHLEPGRNGSIEAGTLTTRPLELHLTNYRPLQFIMISNLLNWINLENPNF